jgi:hypothetical protein
MVEFEYDSYHRVAEPHVYGVNGGVEQLLVYQIGGQSSSGALPEWRRMDVHRIVDFQVLERAFVGPRPTPSGRHSSWDITYEIVS